MSDSECTPDETEEKNGTQRILTRLVKENHNQNIVDVKFCPFGDCSHLVATIGANQVSVYDTCNRGNFVDIVHSYQNLPTDDKETIANKAMLSVCWIKKEHDLWVGAGSADGKIHILSLCESRCKHIIDATQSGIQQLETHPIYSSNLIMALNSKYLIRFYDINTQSCVGRLNEIKAIYAKMNAKGDRLVCITPNNEIREYEIQINDGSAAANDDDGDISMNGSQAVKPASISVELKAMPTNHKLKTGKLGNKAVIITGLYYRKQNENEVIIGIANIGIQIINLRTNIVTHRISGETSANICRFGVSNNGEMLTYGGEKGIVYTYDLKTKRIVNRLNHQRCRRTVLHSTFVPYPSQSILSVSECILWKWDPPSLVKDFFPTNSFFDRPQLFTSAPLSTA